MKIRGVLVITLFVAAAVCHATTERVSRVIDGDTFVIGSGEHVRMIGIDAPEKNDLLGPASTRYLRELIEGKDVWLVADAISRDRDRYQRLLRYVEIEGEDINMRMVRDGYATAYLKFKFTRLDEYRDAQRKAMEQEVGMWGQAKEEADVPEKHREYGGWSRKGIVLLALLVMLMGVLVWSLLRR